MYPINVFHKGKMLCFQVERKFNAFKRTVLFQLTPIACESNGITGKLQLMYDNVEHIFKPNCDELKLNYDLRYSLEKHLKEYASN